MRRIIERASMSKPSNSLRKSTIVSSRIYGDDDEEYESESEEVVTPVTVTQTPVATVTNPPYYYTNQFNSLSIPETMDIENYKMIYLESIVLTYNSVSGSMLYHLKTFYNWFHENYGKDASSMKKQTINQCADFMYNLTQVIKGYIFGLIPIMNSDNNDVYVALSNDKFNNNLSDNNIKKYYSALCYRLLDWWKLYQSINGKSTTPSFKTFSELLCNSIDALIEVLDLDVNLYKYPQYVLNDDSTWDSVYIFSEDVKNSYELVLSNNNWVDIINTIIPKLEEYITNIPSDNYFIPVRTLVAHEIYYICVTLLARLADITSYYIRRTVENEVEGFMERIKNMDTSLKIKQTINNMTIERYYC